MHSATTTSLCVYPPVFRTGVLHVLPDLLLFDIFEHFSFEVTLCRGWLAAILQRLLMLRLRGFVFQGAIVDLDLLSRGCGTPSLGTGVSTGGRAHSPPAPWFLLSAALSLFASTLPRPCCREQF